MLDHRLWPPLALKQALGLLLNGLLPQPDLHRVYPAFLGNLIDSLQAPYSLKTHFGLEFGTVYLTFLSLAHFSYPGCRIAA
jgi:hypothetical protein